MATPSLVSLAIDGGIPVRSPGKPWPQWPQSPPAAERYLLDVLHGRRWTLTGPIRDSELFERRFAREFAAWVGTRHCVPVDHGSSALVIGLESLGLDYGDRVLVPALTWTASATAALRAGLVPVLTDVDAVTGCMSPDDVDLGVDAKAAVVVHWSCCMADMEALTALGDRSGILMVEDCAQAHGAGLYGRTAGTWGRLGCFSTQQGKVLSSGEGGAVVTDDDALALRLEELRADSRSYRTDRGRCGELETVETASIMGSNFCLSEFGAALLCAQLEVIDEQHATRRRNYDLLAAIVEGIPGVRLHRPHPGQTQMSIYELPFIFDELPTGTSAPYLARVLSAELGTEFYLTDEPLNTSRLLRPWTKPTLRPLADEFVRLHDGREFPHADFFGRNTVVTHHSTLLGTESDMEDIGAALRKVVRTLS
ncbi:DegT/DnrJ/EryC1/StrS family aminotransferase [Streptomyces sp. 7N604]